MLSETCKDDIASTNAQMCCAWDFVSICIHVIATHIHKLHSNLVSKKMHVNTDAQIIHEIDMTDGIECFAPSNDIKKTPENQD